MIPVWKKHLGTIKSGFVWGRGSEKMKSTNSEINWNNSRQETGHEFTIKYISKEKKLTAAFTLHEYILL